MLVLSEQGQPIFRKKEKMKVNFKTKNFTVHICVYKLSYQNTQNEGRDCNRQLGQKPT